jgi:parvulin-like peptidyl-prolyl isomerase
MARQHSELTNAAKGGELGFFPRGVVFPMFEEVAFRTPPGEFIPVFETVYGYNIVKVHERREPELKPFAEVKPALMVELARQQEDMTLEIKLAELRDGSSIEVMVDKLRLDADETASPGVAGTASVTR